MLDHRSRPVETERGGDGEWCYTRPGPGDGGLPVLDVDGDDFSAGREVDSASDHVLPAPPSKLVSDPSDDTTIREQPGRDGRLG